MRIVGGFAELFAWVFGSIAVCCILFGLFVRLAKSLVWLADLHKRRYDRARAADALNEASERLYIRIESDRLLSQVFEDQP